MLDVVFAVVQVAALCVCVPALFGMLVLRRIYHDSYCAMRRDVTINSHVCSSLQSISKRIDAIRSKHNLPSTSDDAAL